MTELKPPPNDDLITRHHFYAGIASASNTNEKDIHGIGSKLTKFTETFEVVRDDVKTASIRNKTLITAALVVWTLLGSAISIYVQRGLSTFDKASERIEQMERKIATLEVTNEQHRDLPDKFLALTRRYEDVQRRLEDKEAGKK